MDTLPFVEAIMTKELPKIPPDKYSKYPDLYRRNSDEQNEEPLEKNHGESKLLFLVVLIVSSITIILYFILK